MGTVYYALRSDQRLVELGKHSQRTRHLRKPEFLQWLNGKKFRVVDEHTVYELFPTEEAQERATDELLFSNQGGRS